MALSEKEQELLAQLEAALAADDPKLASTLRGSSVRTLHRRRAMLGGVGFLLGIGVLVAGISIHWSVSVLGFLIMLASTIVALASWRHVNPGETRTKATRNDQLMDRLEERWRHRSDEG